jgi:glycosyltransferase involved in cell wall biosynthesis
MQVHVLTVVEGQQAIEAYLLVHPIPNLTFSFITIPSRRFKHCSGIHYAWWQWSALKAARALLKTRSFDIAHHVTYGSIHVPSQLWQLGLPVVFGPVGGGQVTPPNMLEYLGEYAAAERRRTLFTRLLPYSPLHRYWLSKMKMVLVTNRDTLALVRRMGCKNAELIFDTALPESVMSLEPREFEPRSGPLKLLWVGTMVPRKALPLTLDIFVKVRCDATLTIIGNGIEEAELRAMIAEKGIQDRVFWAGKRLPWMEVQAAYREHDALLFTSLRDSCAAQLLESLAQGLPVITLDLHGGSDLVPDAAGIKVPVVDAAQVIRDGAAAVDRFHSLSPAEKTEMSVAGWTFARSLNWTVRAEQAELLYRKILNQGSGADALIGVVAEDVRH